MRGPEPPVGWRCQETKASPPACPLVLMDAHLRQVLCAHIPRHLSPPWGSPSISVWKLMFPVLRTQRALVPTNFGNGLYTLKESCLLPFSTPSSPNWVMCPRRPCIDRAPHRQHPWDSNLQGEATFCLLVWGFFLFSLLVYLKDAERKKLIKSPPWKALVGKGSPSPHLSPVQAEGGNSREDTATRRGPAPHPCLGSWEHCRATGS